MAETGIKQAEHISSLYYDPQKPGGFSGAANFIKSNKQLLKDSTIVRDWLSGQEAYTLHKPARKRFRRRQTLVGGINEQFQADLIDMQQYANSNNGAKYLLTVIDVFSKYAWVKPITSKHGENVAGKLREVLNERKCRVLQTDKGTEFLNAKVRKLLQNKRVHHFTTENEDTKATVVERFNRTINTKLHKWFTKSRSYRYIDVLQKFVAGYNRTKHRSTGMPPELISKENEEDVWLKLYPPMFPGNKVKFKFKTGDMVRISRKHKAFDKGYLPNWSKEIFEIQQQLRTSPITYRIQDYNKDTIEGTFYEPELQKVISSDIYEIESILQEKYINRKPHLLVKWKGYPASMNSWIPKKELVDLRNSP